MIRTHLNKTQFVAATKISGNFNGNSPVLALLSCSKESYLTHKVLIESITSLIDAHSLYSSLEYVLEHLNKLISKTLLKNGLAITLFQKEGTTMKVASYPSSFLHYPDTSRGGLGFTTVPLSFADTNRVFSEVLEINLRISPLIRFTLNPNSASTPSVRVERNRVYSRVPGIFSTLVEHIGRSMVRITGHRDANTQHASTKHVSKTMIYLRYGVALVITFLAISGLSTALTKKVVVEQQAVNQPWVDTTNLSATLAVTISEQLPSKYVHEQVSMIKSGAYLFTYQTDPNIILQIDERSEIKPIVLDSEQIGKLTGMKKLNDELLVFTHTKPGLVFLNYDKRQWRLVKFSQPKISEYTDIAMYGEYIYVLDSRGRQIWKLEITEDTVTGNPWLKDTRVDLSLASTIAIDGSVYLTTITGDIIKLTQGKKDASFALDSRLSPSLRSADAIMLPSDEAEQVLYVLDRVEKRIIKFSRAGEFIKQFKIELPLPPDAILVSGEDEFIALIRDQIVTLKPIEAQK